MTSFQKTCIDYLIELRQLHGHPLATDELSLGPALDKFLKKAVEIFERPVQIVGNPKKMKSGRPDFTATSNDLPIGYVEAEAYGIDLDNLTGHAKEQNERFRTNLDNFILTNHLDFRLYVGGRLADSAKLPIPPDKGLVNVSESDAETLATLLERFLSGQLPSIASPRDFSMHLARRTRQMRSEVLEALKEQKSKDGDLNEVYQAFKEVLLPDLTEDEFADMYAQTIAYGLFAARCAAPVRSNFSRQLAANLIPKTNPFLRKLFQRIAAHDLDEGAAWIADDIAQLLAQAPIEEVLADFGKRTGKEDPDTVCRSNLGASFLKAMAEKLNLPPTEPHELPEGIAPEDIFHYTYAVFHSPTYRKRYAEFLKIDFPRLPLTSDLDLFRDLSELGKQLVALHLLDTEAAPILNQPISPFPVAGSNEVEKVRYVDTSQRLYINKTQYFDTVPPEVWEFRIGGYQVCEKWLKDRKGRRLDYKDLQHYQCMVVALSETIRLMEAIDERIPSWPLE